MDKSEISGEIINVASGDSITILSLAKEITALFGKTYPPVHEPTREGDIRSSEADVTKINKMLGFVPRVSLAEGLRRTAWVDV